jgi:hypothetical protein
MKKQIADLRFIPIADALLHEETDPSRVKRIMDELLSTGILRNPPIAVPMPEAGKYLILDGATRTTAMREMGLLHIPVQITNYGTGQQAVRLESWHHILPQNSPFEILEQLSRLEAIIHETSAEIAAGQLEKNLITAYMYCSGKCFTLEPAFDANTEDKFPARALLLNKLVGIYNQGHEIYRLAQSEMEELVAEQRKPVAMMVFPKFKPGQIMYAAYQGTLLPAGITRHLIPGRALHLNIPFSLIFSAMELAAKQDWLDQYIAGRILGKQVRYYHESVILFDE